MIFRKFFLNIFTNFSKESVLFYVIWGISGLLLLWFVVFLPVWEGFDEVPNFCYVQHLVEQKSIPRPLSAENPSYCSSEVESTFIHLPVNQAVGLLPQLQSTSYLLYGEFWSREQHFDSASLIDVDRLGTTGLFDIWQAQHPPLPYMLLTVPYVLFYQADFYTRFIVLRIASALIAWVGAYIMWLCLQRLPVTFFARLAAFAAIVLHPMFFFQFARITNESLTFVLFAASWYVLLRFFQDSQRPVQYWYLFGILYGLGLLSKVFFVATLPAVILAMVFFLFQTSPLLRRKHGVAMIVSFIILCAVAAPWYVWQSQLEFVTPGVGVDNQVDVTPENIVERITAVPWIEYFKEISRNFTGFFGWSFLRAPGWYYTLNAVFGFFILVGCLFLNKKERVLAGLAMVFPIWVLIGMSYYNLRFDFLSITGGWYLFSLSAMISVFLAIIFNKIIPRSMHQLFFASTLLFHLSMIIILHIQLFFTAYYAS